MNYYIWAEGYQVTGNFAGPYLHGRIEAPTFKQACELAFAGDNNFDPERMTYWGCGLYSGTFTGLPVGFDIKKAQ